jgi:HSP20 family molecular chaperone IbpA
MAGEAFTICPDVYTYADREHNKLTIEAEIPGVEKKDITVNIHDDSMSLYAPARPRGLPMLHLSPSAAR